MDLNQRIAARREELAKIAKVKEKADVAAADKEIVQKLRERKRQLIDSQSGSRPSSDSDVDAAIAKAALKRVSSDEHIAVAILGILSLLGFFVAWWVGVLFGVVCGFFVVGLKAKYSKQIREESDAIESGKTE